jgi:hypothetical protein
MKLYFRNHVYVRHNFHPDKIHSAQELGADATDSQIQFCEWLMHNESDGMGQLHI